MIDISIIIPSCNERFLQPTIKDILAKAKGKIEIIVYLDEFWPDPPIEDDPRVILIHHSQRKGMRPAINALASIARGKYLMKLDAHCMLDEGFDQKLIADCEPDWTVVPVRYELDTQRWKRKEDKYYEFERIDPQTLKGKRWPEYANKVKGQKLAELMTFQGSCWFMYKDRFFDLEGVDDINYGSMGREAQEICLKSWLSGGMCILSRNTWYAHWSKPGKYVIKNMKKEKKKSQEFAIDFWTNNRWSKQTKTFEWLMNYFEIKEAN